MTFLSPLLLWFLAAASVPVIIHLLNKRRHKTVHWAAMQFLLKATRESRGKKKLRHILILTCRALGIAALAFAAARPVVSGLLGWGANTIDTVVLILDRSASMELRSGDGQAAKRELVLRKVSDAMANIGNPRLVLVDSATGKAQEIASPDVLPEISSTAATDTAADFPALMNTAVEYLGSTTGRAEIWLASDLQGSNWDPNDERWTAIRASLSSLPEKPSVRVLSLAGDSAPNVSLRLLGSRRNTAGLTLDLEILRSEEGRGNLSLPLTISTNRASTTESIGLPGQSLRFQRQIKIEKGDESGHGWLGLPADGNPRDNTVFFAYGPARPTKTLVIAEPGEAADYLLLAAAPPGFENQNAVRVSPADFANHPTSDSSMILWAAPLPATREARILETFLSGGGQVVFLPSSVKAEAQFLGMKWGETDTADSGKFFILADWNRSDGPLRDGIDGTPIPAERLRGIRRATPDGDSAVLARWEDGEAFLTRNIIDRGTVWFLGSIPDYTWSNLGDADILLPVIQRILSLGAERFDSTYLAEVGSEAALPAPGEVRSRADNFSAESSEEIAGVYRLGDRLVAVNRPAAEDDLEIVTKDSLDSMFDGTGYRLLDQVGQSSDPSLSTDVWRAFLLATLFFLISEALLCLPKKPKEENVSKQAFGNTG